METLGLGMKLLRYDYIGGHGSRGYGRISISGLKLECVIGEPTMIDYRAGLHLRANDRGLVK